MSWVTAQGCFSRLLRAVEFPGKKLSLLGVPRLFLPLSSVVWKAPPHIHKPRGRWELLKGAWAAEQAEQTFSCLSTQRASAWAVWSIITHKWHSALVSPKGHVLKELEFLGLVLFFFPWRLAVGLVLSDATISTRVTARLEGCKVQKV